MDIEYMGGMMSEKIRDEEKALHADNVKRWAFANKAIAEGYTDKWYWYDQYFKFAKGNRGPEMHDFTLVNLS